MKYFPKDIFNHEEDSEIDFEPFTFDDDLEVLPERCESPEPMEEIASPELREVREAYIPSVRTCQTEHMPFQELERNLRNMVSEEPNPSYQRIAEPTIGRENKDALLPDCRTPVIILIPKFESTQGGPLNIAIPPFEK